MNIKSFVLIVGLAMPLSQARALTDAEPLILKPIRDAKLVAGVWVQKKIGCGKLDGRLLKVSSTRDISNRIEFDEDFTQIREIRTTESWTDNGICNAVDLTHKIMIETYSPTLTFRTLGLHFANTLAGYKHYLWSQNVQVSGEGLMLFETQDELLAVFDSNNGEYYRCQSHGPAFRAITIWERLPVF